MPIFEYRCAECGKVSEFIEKFDQSPQTTCPQCQAQALEKLISAGNFHLKGSGWYVTDFKDKDTSKDTDKDKDKKQNNTPDTSKQSSTEQSTPSNDSPSKTDSKAATTQSKSTSEHKEK